MHSGRNYSFREVAAWTRRETAIFLLLSTVPTALYVKAGWIWLALPWLPIAMIGTAVAFITGFKNSASYGRLWEARQIWGSIVNTSRAFLTLAKSSISSRDALAVLAHRHIAWLTALRYQLRERRNWENMTCRYNVEFQSSYDVAEWSVPVDPILASLLGAEDLAHLEGKKNRAIHLLDLQTADIAHLVPAELTRLELQRYIASLIDSQGRCERIKNFPYPRQFATLNLFFIWLFIALVPYGLLQEFNKLGDGMAWLTIPASTIVAWVFHTMDKIGESSENPFEGGPNDVPITALSRTIEIDLREMLGESSLPAAIQPRNNILT
jgi:putative membrane protein